MNLHAFAKLPSASKVIAWERKNIDGVDTLFSVHENNDICEILKDGTAKLIIEINLGLNKEKIILNSIPPIRTDTYDSLTGEWTKND